MHYYNFNIGDYASHTRHLNLYEDLAYRRLIDAYYLSEKPFFGSPADIAKDIGMASQIEAVHYVLTKFFEPSDFGWINRRCAEEIAKYHGKQEQASIAGKASAQRRANTRSTPVQPTNNHKPITNNQLNNQPIGFEDFWILYDKKRNRSNALKEWLKANIDENLLKTVLEQARKYVLATAKQYRKDPERWIKYRGWEDEILDNTPQIRKEMPLGSDKQIEEAYRMELGLDPSKARFNSYFEMRNFILQKREEKAKNTLPL